MQTNDSAWNGDTRQIQVFQETAMPFRYLFNAPTHEDRSTGILPNVPNDDDDDETVLLLYATCTMTHSQFFLLRAREAHSNRHTLWRDLVVKRGESRKRGVEKRRRMGKRWGRVA